jgi:biotin synthase
MTKRAHIPATTALGSMEKDYRAEALKAGANVIMVNYTPTKYKELYEIYPGKRCLKEAAGACNNCLPFMAKELNRKIDYSKGNAVD